MRGNRLFAKVNPRGAAARVLRFILTELTTILAFVFGAVAVYQLSLALGII